MGHVSYTIGGVSKSQLIADGRRLTKIKEVEDVREVLSKIVTW